MSPPPTLIDAHCHLEPDDFPDLDTVVERARAAGVARAVLVGQFQAPGDFGHAVRLASERPDYFRATLGIHPHEVARATEADFAILERTCASDGVCAVGEAGLDYYYDRSPRDVQRSGFARQAALAKRLGKPLVVHVRDAHSDCHEVLVQENVAHGVIHCFTGNWDEAKRYLDLGFAISISGIVTYKKTEALQDAVRQVPIDSLMVETDSPFLAPVPFRGKKNEPAWVRQVAEHVATLRGMTLEALAEATTANAARVFGFAL